MNRLSLLVGLLALAPAAAGAQTTERIVAFGDSLTDGIGDETNTGGYPPRLAALLSTGSHTVTVESEGVPGETTAEGLSRLDGVSGIAADSIIIMEGVNDVFDDISFETIAANLAALESKAKARGFGKVYISTTTPIGNTPFGDMIADSFFLAQHVREAYYARDWLMPDPHQAFYDLENIWADFYTFDRIHPNAAGYDELARIYAEFIEEDDTLAPAYNFGIPRLGLKTPWPSDTLIQVILFDPLSGVDQNATLRLTINGNPVTTEVSGEPFRTVLEAHPGNLSGEIDLGLVAQDRATPPNTRDHFILRFSAAPSAFVTGDINRDGRVDGADLVLLGVSFGSKSTDKRYDDRADFDFNGFVDGIDLAQLAANFGRASSSG